MLRFSRIPAVITGQVFSRGGGGGGGGVSRGSKNPGASEILDIPPDPKREKV